MYGLDNASGVNTMPALAPVSSPTPLWFTEGGAGLAASYPGQDWFNMVQAELLGVLTAGGVKPEKGKLNQLSEAISKIINQRDYATNTALTNGLNKKLDKTGGVATGSITVPSFTVRDPKVDLWLNLYPANSAEVGNYAYFQYGNSSGTGGRVGIPRTAGSEMFMLALSGDSYNKSESNNLFANKTVTQLQQFNSIVSGKRTVQAESNAMTFGLYIDVDRGAFLTGKGSNGDYYGELAHPMDKKSGTIMRVEEALGVNQKYKDVTSSRTAGATYTNTNRNPIFLSVSSIESNINAVMRVAVYIDGVIVAQQATGGGYGDSYVTKRIHASVIVPPSSTYRVVIENSTVGLWMELS